MATNAIPVLAAGTNAPPAGAGAPELEAEMVRELKLPAPVLGFDAAPDGQSFYVAMLDGRVGSVASESGEFLLLGRHESYASSVHRVPGSDLAISGGYDGTLQWHDLKAQRTVRKVKAHAFWSWQTAVSRDGRHVASVTGQYQCGGYKYEPAPEREPSVKLFEARTGKLLRAFSHVPPVQSVAFTPDGRHLAAGNLMGEVRVWDVATGREAAAWTTPSFTGWGIIKGHYYTGGIHAMLFAPDGEQLLVAGMGSTRDPAAGNGRQLWERFAWRETPPKKLGETRENESGRGLMETLTFHPAGQWFVMAGRLFNGKWNTAFFDAASGALLHALDAKMRVTRAVFAAGGTRLLLAGTTDQGRKKDGQVPESGRIKSYRF